ncbi:hypothetical protein ABZ464_23680 [Streptomyces sp. NPDC005820]|uniref:hypothetical protein n=1 Tax=Streptomyces sp. NPDC005820 TaxID=3157069 RepID=UPI003410459B
MATHQAKTGPRYDVIRGDHSIGGGGQGSHMRDINGVPHYFQYAWTSGGDWTLLVRTLGPAPGWDIDVWTTIRNGDETGH